MNARNTRQPFAQRRRRFTDALQGERCSYDITLGDGSQAQCGRTQSTGCAGYCRQHWRMIQREGLPISVKTGREIRDLTTV
jgi:hypothetical protein